VRNKLLLTFIGLFLLTVGIAYSACPGTYYCDNTGAGSIKVCSVPTGGKYNGSFAGSGSHHNWTLVAAGQYVRFTASLSGETDDDLDLRVYSPTSKNETGGTGPGSSHSVTICDVGGLYAAEVFSFAISPDNCASYNITISNVSVGCCQDSNCEDGLACSLDKCEDFCTHCTRENYNVSTCNYYACCSGLQQCFDGVCRVSCPDFTVSLNPTSVSITVPQSGYNSSNSTINVSSINGFNSPVTFSGSWIGSSPTGVTFYFTPNSVTPPANGNVYANVTINVSSTASTGTYTLRINATSGFTSKYADLTVNILPSAAAPFDFSVSVSPSSGSVVQGNWTNTTVTVTLLSGTPQTVTLSVSGLPSGTTYTFIPSSSGLPTFSRTLNISTSYSTPNGTYTITITGSGGGLTRTATYTLTVNPSPVCVRANPVVSISPTYGYGRAGQTLTYTVNVTNRDSTACGESTFSLVGIVPEGFSYSFSQTTLVVKPVGFSNTNTSYFYVTSNCTSKDNYPHTIIVNATNTNAPNYFASNTSYYYVYQHFYVSVTPSSKSGISGSTLSYNIQLTNNKWTTCPATTFTFTGNVPAGWSYTITPQVTLSSGSTTTAPTFNITSPCTAVPGNYFINVTANDTLTGITRTSSSSNYTVINPSCSIQATPFFSTGPFFSTLTATFYNLNTTCFPTATLNCGNETIVNLAYNPSFEGKTWQIDENNTNFEDWDISRNPDNGIIKTWVETSNTHSGNKALHWRTEAPSSTNLALSYYSNNSKRFVIDENKYLEAGLWSYVIAGSSGSDVSFYFWDSNGNYLGRFWGRDKLEGWAPNQWRRVSYVWYPSSMGSGNGFIPKGAKYARLNIYANWHEGGIKERIDDDVFVRQFDDLSTRSLQISGNQVSTTCYYPPVSNISYYRAFANVSANILVSCPTTIVDTPNTFDFTVSVSPTPNYNRLVGFWPFDEGWGISSADKSGYGNNASLGVTNWEYAPAWTLGKFGYALGFDGIDDRVRINNVPVNTSAGAYNTVAFWMYWDGKDNQMPFGWQQAYGLWLVGGCFGFNTGQDNVLGISSSGLANRWVHVVAIFYNGVPSSTTVALYIDGVKQNIFACRGSTTASRSVTSTLQISGWAYSTGYYFGGIIDEFKIWNRALSDEEVLAEYRLAKVAQGQKHFANVSATLLIGSSQQVNLSLAGCPPNAECSLLPNASMPTYNSVLTVSTSTLTPTGNYTITIRGTNGTVTKEMNYTIEVLSECVKANPTVEISPISKQGDAGEELSYTVYLTNNDNIACSARTFNLSLVPKFDSSGWNFTFYLQDTKEILTDKQIGKWGSGTTCPEDPFNTYYHDSRTEFILFPEDLTVDGMRPAQITGFSFKVSEKHGRPSIANFRIRLQHTTKTSLNGWTTTGWNLVYGPTSFTTTPETWKDCQFSTPFFWNQLNNLLVDISRDDTAWVAGGGMYIRNTGRTNQLHGTYHDSLYPWPYDSAPILHRHSFVPALKISGLWKSFTPIPTIQITLPPQQTIVVNLNITSPSAATAGSYKFNVTATSENYLGFAEGEYKIKFACPPGMCSAENICILAGECWGYQQICYPDGQIKNSCGDGKCNCGEDEKTCEADCVGIYFKLFRGWNLISLPYKKITSISGDTCKADQLHFFYYENYSWKKVVGIQNIKGGYGYWTNPEWFTKAFPCYINVTTNKNENVTLNDLPKLKKGFNAIGAPATPVKLSELKCLNDAGVSVPIRYVYYWHPYYSQWIQLGSEDELKPEPPYYYGYWIYVDEDCKLTK
jgi:uncharacterized membrane protein